LSGCEHNETCGTAWFPGELRWLARRIRPFLWWHIASFLCIAAGILNRRQKAFVSRRPIVEIAKHWAGLAETARSMHCLSLGIIDERSFREEVLRTGNGQSTHAVTLLRLFSVEAWLKQMMASGVWSGSLARPC
jgi:hypothetical protein